MFPALNAAVSVDIQSHHSDLTTERKSQLSVPPPELLLCPPWTDSLPICWEVVTRLNDGSSISQELLHLLLDLLAGLRPGEPSGMFAFLGNLEWGQ